MSDCLRQTVPSSCLKQVRSPLSLLSASVHAGGMLSQQEAVSQGLLLQQAALALQMQGTSTLYGGELPPDASTQALHAHLRQQHYGESVGANAKKAIHCA